MNYQTDKLVIVFYPRVSGGKFLINCLGLSDSALLQHQDLVDFDQQSKINYINQQLEIARKSSNWQDLGLGCEEFFGRSGLPHFVRTRPLVHTAAATNASHGNRWFFVVAHDILSAEHCLQTWPNAKLILFRNPAILVNQRSKDQQTIDNANCFDFLTRRYPKHNRLLDCWRTEWYLDEALTLQNLQNIYNKMHMSDFNESAIKDYYRQWTKLLNIPRSSYA